ncbi:LacI family DNA-binding transcriptional regulator [Streptacidiphilus fuscans]|uniref:DeoR/GlpR family transcriptional regulator n=1 Tax=Streptacidiphilus fuscans TaxID=2789292 RepID=A0A931BC54_9ACTN|nr:substrate-binding domain-containing protein [Streptacidiphilus fuscans]MBF9071513.1 DeoR/GlpR family transcriptional regulator [Streptacidiphilus fuscans]
MRPSVDERHEQILLLVREHGSLRVTDLAEALGVSAVTARRDVEMLAEAGRLQRAHGFVTWPDPAAELRSGQLLGAAAPARRVLPPDTVLGLLVPAASYYYAEVIRGAKNAAAAAGVRLILGISDYRPEQDRAQIASMLNTGVSGLLLTPTWPSGAPSAEEEDAVLELGVPTVLLERRVTPGSPLAELDRVCTDHVHGACVAVRHLASLGRRRIALLARPGTPTADFIATGYQVGMDALGLRPPRTPVAEDFTERLEALPTAIVEGEIDAALVHTDSDALVLLQQLQSHGLRVPDDLAIVAYDDETAALADVPLSAIAPPKHALGATAVDLLLQRLTEGPDEQLPHRHLDLLPALHVRASTTLG